MPFERFALAGDAIFTVRSLRTGVRFTYRIDTDRLQPARPSFVSVLTGPDNSSDYTFLGSIFDGGRTYRHGTRSRISADAPSAVAFAWLWSHRGDADLDTRVEIMHAGRCCRCGRTLTTPESVAAGIGPECSKKED